MKTVIIIILFVALIGGAFLSRPSQDDFKAMMEKKHPVKDKELVQQVLAQLVKPSGSADGYVYKDRLLWVNVEKDGKTVYTGAFATWFHHGGD